MKQFNDWMDARGMSPEETAAKFGKSAGTIRNWRSQGVPQNLQEWVLSRMAEIDATTPHPDTPQNLLVEVTREQFRQWNRAALVSGLLIEDWAIQQLDAAAAEEEAEQTGSVEPFNPLQSLPKVAEEPKDYGKKD